MNPGGEHTEGDANSEYDDGYEYEYDDAETEACFPTFRDPVVTFEQS
jgi:hypothetical protein